MSLLATFLALVGFLTQSWVGRPPPVFLLCLRQALRHGDYSSRHAGGQPLHARRTSHAASQNASCAYVLCSARPLLRGQRRGGPSKGALNAVQALFTRYGLAWAQRGDTSEKL